MDWGKIISKFAKQLFIFQHMPFKSVHYTTRLYLLYFFSIFVEYTRFLLIASLLDKCLSSQHNFVFESWITFRYVEYALSWWRITSTRILMPRYSVLPKILYNDRPSIKWRFGFRFACGM